MKRVLGKLRSSLVAVGLSVVFAGAGTAKGLLYDCDITKRSQDLNWVSDKYAFVFAQDGSVSVIDSMTLVAFDGPLQAKVRVRPNGTTRLRWVVSGLVAVNGEQFPSMSMMADLDRAAKTVTVNASLNGYGAKIRGTGTCKTRTQ